MANRPLRPSERFIQEAIAHAPSKDPVTLWEGARAALKGTVWRLGFQDEYCNRDFSLVVPRAQAETIVAGVAMFERIREMGRLEVPEGVTPPVLVRKGVPGTVAIRSIDERTNYRQETPDGIRTISDAIEIKLSAGSMQKLATYVGGMSFDLSENKQIGRTI